MSSCPIHLLSPLTDELRSGRLLLPCYLDMLQARFEAVEPQLQAFVPGTVDFDRLRRQAAQLEKTYPDPSSRPLLFGAVVGVKDIIRVEGLPTRAGALLPPGLFAGAEAQCIRRLRAAGAIILGKTVTTEFAYFEPGPTRHPTHPHHTPGGSSSGSAAAVAAELCPLALGSQTVGSVIRPASFCGIIGFKPTFDRVPIDGVVPFSAAVDTLGWFTRDLDGAQLAASVLCDGWNPAASPDIRPSLAVPVGPYLARADSMMLECFHHRVRTLRGAGIEVIAIDAMSDFADIAARHQDLIAGEVSMIHHAWFEVHHDRYRPRTRAIIERGALLSAERMEACRAGREALRHHLESLLTSHGADAWIAPAACGAAPEGLDYTGDPIMNLPWTHAGMPVLSLPMAVDERGLPMGLQIAGRHGRDEQLMSVAGVIAEALAAHLC